MVKNYPALLVLFVIVLNLGPMDLNSQELKVFTINDFDLHGNVKTCLVITDYGKEEFEFDEAGLLTKSVTRFNESDYDITYYKYAADQLLEKRLETYRDGVFDKSTSIANLYEIDTTGNRKVTEKIFSYNQEFIDQYEYYFDIDNNLVNIKRSNNTGIDETTIEYTYYKGEYTKSYFLNGVIQKSIRTSTKKKNGSSYEIILSKEFIDGIPLKATEQKFNSKKALLLEIEFAYDVAKKSLEATSTKSFSYDDKGLLTELKKQTGPLETKQMYIYQFDNEENGNWIKKIITPDNSYTTRKISYYETAVPVEEKN